MKTTTRTALIFSALTLAGLTLGNGLSAVTTAVFLDGGGGIRENLAFALVSLLLAPFVLTLGLPISLMDYPWMGWPSLAGCIVWLVGAILVFRGRPALAYRCGFGGAALWALMSVPVLKIMNSV
jgi:hypothetical protein